jgi:integrase
MKGNNMARLRKRGNKYSIDIHYNGRRIIKALGTSDKSVAEIIRKNIESDITLGKFDLKHLKKKNISLKDYFEEYFKYAASIKKATTIKNERFYADKFVDFIGNRNLRQLDTKLLDEWKANLLQKHSAAYFNIIRRFLHAAFNKAKYWKYIESNPISDIDQVKVEKKRIYLTVTEIIKLFAELDKDINNPNKFWMKQSNMKFWNFFEFLLLTGMRRQEAISLKMNQIDLEQGLIMLEQTKSKEDRIIPMNRRIREIIVESGEGLFNSINPSSASHKFKSLSSRAGLRDNFKLHSLRHTFATMLNDNRVDITGIQSLLGHADISTTRMYSKTTVDTLKNIMYKLKFPLKRTSEPTSRYNSVTRGSKSIKKLKKGK